MKYILYKHPVQKETLAIVQYLFHARSILLLPTCCIERNHPDWATDLPSIETEERRYVGLNECVEFFERQSGVDGVFALATDFKARRFL